MQPLLLALAWLLPIGLALHLAQPPEVPQPLAALTSLGSTGCWDEGVFGNETHELSWQMCQQSRSNRASSSLELQRAVQALGSGQCLEVLAIGGSVTAGAHGVAGASEAWPARLEQWLNKRHPCKGAGGHAVRNFGVGGSGSNVWADELTHFRADPQHPLWQADVVVVEVSSNDVHLLANHFQPSKVEYWTEMLARQLLALPKRPALIWLEAAWTDRGPKSKPPYHKDGSAGHLRVLEYYGIPQVSTLSAFMPIASKEKREWLDKVYFAGDPVHPGVLGHKMLAQLLAFLFEEELAQSRVPLQQRKAWFTALPDSDALPELLYVDAPTWNLYRDVTVRHVQLWDEAAARPSLLRAEGFAFAEDVPGRPGLLALKPGAELLVAVPPGQTRHHRHNAPNSILVNLALLKSYEHMGVAEVEVLLAGPAPTAPGGAEGECGTERAAGAAVVAKRRVDSLWDSRVSLRDVEVLRADGHAAGTNCIFVRVRVVAAEPARSENKVKLLSLTVL